MLVLGDDGGSSGVFLQPTQPWNLSANPAPPSIGARGKADLVSVKLFALAISLNWSPTKT